MNFIEAIILGLVQGLTEFIPVSSSGHLVLVQKLFGFGIEENLSFEIFLHLGTLLAVVIYFYRPIWDLIRSLFIWRKDSIGESHTKNRKIVLYLIISTVATGVIYLIFGDWFKAAYQMPRLVASLLIVTGVILYLSDMKKDAETPQSNIGIVKSTLIGLAQGIAILPGISRSGSTIAASVLCGMKRKDAAQFSFLLSIPAILGANLTSIKEFQAIDSAMWGNYIAGFIVSFVSGYLVIAFLIRLIQAGSLKYFSYYLWAVGVITIAYLSFF
ncbi:MAG: undecaprenyl-diphosphate phosphatase [Candidatus Cloacimonetes bacterium]|nr:undecaprenyl-diphosphate phosphatase [Candidatus Cloacimonadota bacterium]